MNDSALRVVKWSAAYDLLVTAPFATPWTAHAVFGLLAKLHVALGLAGPPPQLDNLGLMFVNLMGSLVVVWSLLRFRAATHALGAADTVARLLFATWMMYALAHGASAVIVPFVIFELGWAIVQGLAVWGKVPRCCVVTTTETRSFRDAEPGVTL
jgi:hypothetical protein